MNKKLLLFAFASMALFAHPADAQRQTFKDKYLKDGMYFFDDLQKIRQAELFTTYKSEFGLGADDEMRQINNVVDKDGKLNTKYALFHKSIPVEGSMMNVQGAKGIVLSANGFLLTGLNVDKNNIITPDQAVQIAVAYVAADTFAWQDSTREAFLKEEDGNPDATAFPQPELVITKKRGDQYPHTVANYTLCYKMRIEAISPASLKDIYVDAATGDIFEDQDAGNEDYNVSGTHLWTWYNGEHWDMNTESCTFCTQYWLHDAPRHIRTFKYYLNHQYDEYKIKDGNNNWVEDNTKTAASTHWSIERAFDYFLNRHGRWGTDYNGKEVWAKIDAYANGANAMWTYHDNKDYIFVRPDNGHSAAALDVIAHEYTHGMVYASSQLGILGDFDARSLNEAYADIFGVMAERYYNGWCDWSFGESMGTYQRNFADPHADFGQIYTNNGAGSGASPAKYLEPGYWSAVNPHANGGVMRKWFYLMANGGNFNGVTVQPLGIEMADNIAYIVFNWWLWCNLRYPEAASQTVAEVKTDFGNCSQAHKQTVNALRAVGFNVPVPFCFKVGVDGPVVIDPGNIHVKFSAKLNDITDPKGTYIWSIPKGWTVTTNQSEFTINNVTDFNSKMVKVTYIEPNGNATSDSMAVHFTDVNWTPTPPPPAVRLAPPVAEAVTGGLELFPNPASTSVTLNLTSGAQSGNIEIYDLNGRIVRQINMAQPSLTLDLNEFAEGMYLVKVRTADKVYTEKLSVLKK